MRKYIIILCVGCLLLMGCRQELEETLGSDSLMQEETTDINVDGTIPGETEVAGTVVSVPGTFEWGDPLISTEERETLPGSPLSIYAQGKTRITYTHNQNYVRYITSPAALDHYGIDALKQYDETFFEKKALVLVCETVTSGSLQVSIDQILQQDSQMTVVLSREMPGEVGTTDMATWLIWAEVDAVWDGYSWVLHNPMLKPETSSTH